MYVFVSLSGEENVCRYGNRFGWLLIFDDCVTRDQTTDHGKGNPWNKVLKKNCVFVMKISFTV